MRAAVLVIAVLLGEIRPGDSQTFSIWDLTQAFAPSSPSTFVRDNSSSPDKKKAKKGSAKPGPTSMLFHLIGVSSDSSSSMFADVVRQDDVTLANVTTNDTSVIPPAPRQPGLLSMFTPRQKKNHKKQLKGTTQVPPFDAPQFGSGLSAMLDMINRTALDRKGGRKGESDHKGSKHSKGDKGFKSKGSKKGGKKGDKNKSKKGRRYYGGGDSPTLSANPSSIVYDPSPNDGPALAPLIQGFLPTPAVAPSTGPPSVPTPGSTNGGATIPTPTNTTPSPATNIQASPTLPPTSSPVTRQPSSSPTASPTIERIPSDVRSCIPTIGPCVDTVDELETAAAGLTTGDTLSVCAGTDPLVTQTALVLRASDVKLCCLGSTATRGCVLQSAGNDNNLEALGSSVRLQDMTFSNGVSDSVFGGNVAIDGEGDHVIDKCQFLNGQATQFGGNMFVRTTGTLTVVDSTFSGGRAVSSGGGLYVLNARDLNITGTVFANNSVSGQDSTGGGLFSVLDNTTIASTSQSLTIQATTFEDNTADLGGGFFVTQLGSLPNVGVVQTTFTDNTARQAGGAGAIADSLDSVRFRMDFSISNGNQGGICNDILGFYDNSTTPECFSVGASYP